MVVSANFNFKNTSSVPSVLWRVVNQQLPKNVKTMKFSVQDLVPHTYCVRTIGMLVSEDSKSCIPHILCAYNRYVSIRRLQILYPTHTVCVQQGCQYQKTPNLVPHTYCVRTIGMLVSEDSKSCTPHILCAYNRDVSIRRLQILYPTHTVCVQQVCQYQKTPNLVPHTYCVRTIGMLVSEDSKSCIPHILCAYNRYVSIRRLQILYPTHTVCVQQVCQYQKTPNLVPHTYSVRTIGMLVSEDSKSCTSHILCAYNRHVSIRRLQILYPTHTVCVQQVCQHQKTPNLEPHTYCVRTIGMLVSEDSKSCTPHILCAYNRYVSIRRLQILYPTHTVCVQQVCQYQKTPNLVPHTYCVRTISMLASEDSKS